LLYGVGRHCKWAAKAQRTSKIHRLQRREGTWAAVGHKRRNQVLKILPVAPQKDRQQLGGPGRLRRNIRPAGVRKRRPVLQSASNCRRELLPDDRQRIRPGRCVKGKREVYKKRCRERGGVIVYCAAAAGGH